MLPKKPQASKALKAPSPVREPSIRVSLLPRDTNEAGTIFGGVILHYIDLAGGIEAHKHANIVPGPDPGSGPKGIRQLADGKWSGGPFPFLQKRFVTVAMKEVVFKAPVYVGDVVSFYTRTLRIGRTSVTVKVEVEARRRYNPSQNIKVTEADVVYVAVDAGWRPVPVLP